MDNTNDQGKRKARTPARDYDYLGGISGAISAANLAQISPALQNFDWMSKFVQRQNEQLAAIVGSANILAGLEASHQRFFADLNGIDTILKSSYFALNQGIIEQLGNLNVFASQATEISRLIDQISFPSATAIKSLVNSLPDFTAILPEIRLPVLVWDAGLSTAIQSLANASLFPKYPLFSERLLEPYVSLGKFIQETGEQLEHTDSEEKENALKGSLALAQEQAIASTALLQETVQKPVGRKLAPKPVLNSLEVQQAELLAGEPVPANSDYNTLLSLSPTATLQAKTRTILSLVARCDEASKLKNQAPIFTPTIRVLDAYANLPWIAVVDRTTLGNFIDYLFFIFYEAAGSTHLRFSGLVSDDDCQAIWTIKHLRNKYLRHDPDHGDQRSIDKSWEELAKKFAWLGVKTLPPTSPTDFQLIQERLLQELEIFLTRLLNALSYYVTL